MTSGERHKQIFFTSDEWDKIALMLVSEPKRYRENIIIPPTLSPVQIKSNEEKMIEAAMESCPVKATMSCVLGLFNTTSFLGQVSQEKRADM